MDFRFTAERPFSVAILSDISDEIGLLQYMLKLAVGSALHCQQYNAEMLSTLDPSQAQLLMLDFDYGGRNYIDTLNELAERSQQLPPCIVLVDHAEATGNLRDALRAGCMGVYDYLCKTDLSVNAVKEALAKSLQQGQTHASKHALHTSPSTSTTLSQYGNADINSEIKDAASIHTITIDLVQWQMSIETETALGLTPNTPLPIDSWLSLMDERSASELNNLLRQLNQPGVLARVISGAIRTQSGEPFYFELSDIDAIANQANQVTHLRMSLSLQTRDSKSIIETEGSTSASKQDWSASSTIGSASKDYWYDIAHSLPTMGLVLDESGIITEVIMGDPSCTRYFPSAKIGQHLATVTDEKNHEACEERITKALNTGTAQHQTLAFSGPDGMRWFDSTITKLRSEPGSPRRGLWTANEITQARLAYQELLKDRDTLADLLDNAPVYFYQKDREGRYLRANISYCKAYGMHADALLGRSDSEIFSSETCEQLTEGDAHIFEQSGSVQYTTEGISDPGSTMTHWIKFALTDNNGATQSLCAVGMQTNRMTADSGNTSEENIAHTGAIGTDFKHIISSIVSYTEIAIQQKTSGRQHKLIQHLDTVLQASQRAKELVLESNGQKSANNIQSGVALSPLVNEIIQMMQPTLPSTLDFQVDIDNVTGTTSVDPLYFQRIVMQLLITARDEAKSNDKISLSLSNMEYTNNMCVSCHQPIDGPHLVLSVTTANSGINPDDLQKMIDATTKNVKNSKNNVITMSHTLNGHALIDHSKETISVLLLFKEEKDNA